MTHSTRLKVYKGGSRWTFDVVTIKRSYTTVMETSWPVVWEGLFYNTWQEAFDNGIDTLKWWTDVKKKPRVY